MAGTVTVENAVNVSRVKRITWTWTSAVGGAADGVSTAVYGEVLALVTIPDAVAAPTDLYDITITDENGYDVMQGAGANRATATTETAVPTAKSVAFGVLTLNVAAAGDAKSGIAILYVLGP